MAFVKRINMLADSQDTIIHFINVLLSYAIEKSASDIHIESFQTSHRIRIRINGVLKNYESFEHPIDPRMLARIKIMANLDTTEKRLPQDGQIQFNIYDKTYCIRISSCPTLYGEKMVLRILYHHQFKSITELGMTIEQQTLFLHALEKSQGFILVCGPTGSGKTMTLYAALSYLNHPHVNIVSVEDPVEVAITGINQVHVNTLVNLTFHRALRSLLRQDPDIIMVGEIRDKETAKITLKASQTGHLVLSTLHSRSALKALLRLEQMGIAQYDLLDSFTLIISQRLLRKLCDHCKKPVHLNEEMAAHFGLSTQDNIFTASSCEKCHEGYLARTAIFEFLPFTGELISCVLKHNSFFEVEQIIEKNALYSLKQQAIFMVKQGITSLEEIKRTIL